MNLGDFMFGLADKVVETIGVFQAIAPFSDYPDISLWDIMLAFALFNIVALFIPPFINDDED